MVNSATTVALLAYSIGTTFSLVFGILLILTHIAIPRLLKHPGCFILAHCITHLLMNVQWYTGVPEIQDYFLQTDAWYYVALISILAYLLSWGYITVLSLEIMLKIIYPAKAIYCKRLIILHALVWLLSLLILAFVLIVGEPGISFMHTCFIQKNSNAEYIFLAPAVFYTPIIFLSLIVARFKTRESGQSLLRNHSLVVIVFWITMIPTVLSHFLRNVESLSFILIEFAIISGSLSGFCITLVRLSNRRLMKELHFMICKRRMKAEPVIHKARATHLDNFRMPLTELDTTINEESPYYADIYANITICVTYTQTILELLTTLTVRFQKESPININDIE